LLDAGDVLDSTLIRMPKTYPAYTGSYSEFSRVIAYLNQMQNLYPIGRNGMHKYNNSDHSMLTAMTAVDNILAGNSNKDNLWQINTEEEYHEAKSE
jgi:protoporphyrinogen oxidase